MAATEKAPSNTGGTTIRFDQDVRAGITVFCRVDRRKLSDAVNLLVIEALTARGLWPTEPKKG